MLPHLDLTPNEHGRDFVVGDVHGEYDKLMSALDEVDFDFEVDRLFAVGDLIDRGPDNLKCLNLMYEPWFYSVRGNHEQLMFDSIVRNQPESYQCWMANGGLWALEHLYADYFMEVVFDLDDRMPWWITVGNYGICHARPPMLWDKGLLEQTPQRMIWGRDLNNKAVTISGIDMVFVGHTPQRSINTVGNITYCDVGAVFGDKPLELLELTY